MSDLCLKLSTGDMWHIKNKVELIYNGNKAYSLISNGMKVGRISIPNGITDVQFIPETNNLMFTYLNELGEYDKIEINVDSIVNLNMDMGNKMDIKSFITEDFITQKNDEFIIMQKKKSLYEQKDAHISNINYLKKRLNKPLLNRGNLIALVDGCCEDFENTERVYEIVDKVNEVYSIQINGLIVKQVSGEKSMIFSLTNDDCKELGIEYEPCLQLFPINMKWCIPKSEMEEINFNIEKSKEELNKVELEIKKLEDEELKRKADKKERLQKRLNEVNKEINDTVSEMKKYISSQRRAFIELNSEYDYISYHDVYSNEKYLDDNDFKFLNNRTYD